MIAVVDDGPVFMPGGRRAVPGVGLRVMALDAGHAPEEFKAHPDWKDIAPSIAESATLGDGLRRAREQSGKSLAELADETNLPTRFLLALAQNDWSPLPSRFLLISHVLCYSSALGLADPPSLLLFQPSLPHPSLRPTLPAGRARPAGALPPYRAFLRATPGPALARPDVGAGTWCG